MSFVRPTCSSGFKRFYPITNFSLTYTITLPYCADILQFISPGLTPSAQRNLIRAHCSRMVQWKSGVSVFTQSA